MVVMERLPLRAVPLATVHALRVVGLALGNAAPADVLPLYECAQKRAEMSLHLLEGKGAHGSPLRISHS